MTTTTTTTTAASTSTAGAAMAFPFTTLSSGSPPFVSRIEENSAGEAAAATPTPTPTPTTTTTSIPAHLIVSEREMPELSGIIEEVSSPTAPPAMSARAQTILATTRYVILPPGWSRVFYSHADDGLDLKKKGPSPQQQQKKVLGRGRGRPKKDQQQQQQPSRKIKKAYSVYYVTSSGRVLLSAEEAMHFLHRADVACRCFLPTAGLAFNEVFSFEADIGTVALHSRNDLLLSEDAAAAASSRCLDWCATFHGHLELEDRLRTTKRYMLHRETAHPLEAYSLAKLRATSSINNNNNRSEEDDDDSLSNISAEFELTHEVAAMLTSSRRELLVTEEGQVYVRALTADHLKHLTYELWLAGVNTDLPNRSRAVASNNDDQEEQEEEEFAAFFDGPVFGRRLGRAGRLREEGEHSEGSSSSSHETGSKDDEPSLVFLYNRPTTADPTPSKFDLGKQMAAASLSTDGTVAFFDETPSDEVTAYLQEKDVEELQAMRDFFKGGGSGLPQDELEEEEEEDQSDSSEEESISLSSEHSSDNEEVSDDDDDDDDFLLSDVPEDGNLEMEESEEEGEGEKEEEEAKTAKKVSTEEGRQSPAAAAAVAADYDPDDLMTDDDSYEILPRFPPDPEDLMTEDEDEGDNNDEEGGEGNDEDEEHHEDHPNQSLPPPPPDHLLPSVSLVALADIDPKRRLTRSLVTTGKVVTVANNNPKQRKTATVAAAPAASAASATVQQPKKRKKRKRIIPRDLYVRRPKPVPKKVPTDDAPSDRPPLRSSKRNAATVAKESIRLTALNLY